MAAKKKKQSKNLKQPGIKTPKNSFVQRHKLLVVVIVFIVGGLIGAAVQRYSAAQCAGAGCGSWQTSSVPTCKDGSAPKLDVVILLDYIDPASWPDPNQSVGHGIAIGTINIIKAQGIDLMFYVRPYYDSQQKTWTQSPEAAAAAVQAIPPPMQPTSVSELDIEDVIRSDPRPDVSNLVAIITDAPFGNPAVGETWKEDGIYFVPIVYGSMSHMSGDLHGSINEAKCMRKAKPSNPSPSPSSPGPNPGNSSGSTRSGSGSGSRGSSTPSQGIYLPDRNSGWQGGGTSDQADRTNSLPQPDSQKAKKVDSPIQELLAFFKSGKLFGIGSDPHAQTPGDLVTNPTKMFVNIWFYVIGVSLLLVIPGFKWLSERTGSYVNRVLERRMKIGRINKYR